VNTVALAATIGGSVVGLAGVISNVVLAKLRQGQELDLADRQHVHERELARGDRLYERRALVYEQMMGVVATTMEHVERRNPMISFSNEPPLPDEPSVDDQRAMQIKLRTHGSKAVGDAFHDWVQKVRQFQLNATAFEMVRDQRAPFTDEREVMDDARVEAREAADKLARLLADELASF
jgi:hypothetical protein